MDIEKREYNPYDLSDRKKKILKAIVESHIEFGEPVGSKYLISAGYLNCSSATIRNEMAELENMGYLEHPYTSSGRVPSEMGYRFYVDSLAEQYKFTESEVNELKSSLYSKQKELDNLMDTAVKLASKFTNYTALSAKTFTFRTAVDKFEVVYLNDHNFLLVMLIGSTVRTQNLKTAIPINEEAVKKLTEVLNKVASGISPSDIPMNKIMEMEEEMGKYDFLVGPTIKAACKCVSPANNADMKIDGVNKLLSYPDFYDGERLGEMLDLFEKKDDLIHALTDVNSGYNDDKVHIIIGSENSVKIMDNSTVIFKTIRKDNEPVGLIGIIGPTRIDYKRAIAMVNMLSDGISGLVSEGGKTENDSGG